MAVPAEILHETYDTPPPEWPLVIDISQMPEDELLRQRAGILIRRAGALALRSEVAAAPEVASEYPTLMHAIHAASRGDLRARSVVERSALTESAEQVYKAGHITETELELDESDRLWQNGQLLEDIYTNALRFVTAEMHSRSRAETRNGIRMQGLHRFFRQGYWFLYVSRFIDGKSDEEAARMGFFVEDKVCTLNAIGMREDGVIVHQTAFVAGVLEAGGERHDVETAEALAAEDGIDLTGKNDAETIEASWLAHKSRLPNGAIDLGVRWSRISGDASFPDLQSPEEYAQYLEACRQREVALMPAVERVVNRLTGMAPTITTPVAATEWLHDLVQQEMVDRAFEDRSIDPRVFGPEAAEYIEEGRMWQDRGEHDRFLLARNNAQETAQSWSCPFAVARENGNTEASADGEGNRQEASNVPNNIRCIKCRKYAKREQVVKPESWRCPHCSYEVDICTGQVLSTQKIREQKPQRKESNIIAPPFWRKIAAEAIAA